MLERTGDHPDIPRRAHSLARADTSDEGKKAEVLARSERLRELIEEDVNDEVLDRAEREVGRSLDGLTRAGRAGREPATESAPGESPTGL